MVNVVKKIAPPLPVARDIQIGIEWDDIEYIDYAIIPDNLLEDILATKGWCDVEVGEDGKTIVGFTALEIPDYVKNPEPTVDDILNALLGVSV